MSRNTTPAPWLSGPLLPLGLMLLGLALLGIAYADTLASFHDRWSSTVLGYSHGYLLLLVGAYLIYRRRFELAATPVQPLHWMALPLLGVALFWLAGHVAHVRIAEQIALPALFWCWVTLIFGWRVGRIALFPFAILYMGIPLWDGLGLPLRQITVVVTQWFLNVMSIPALVDGFYITVPAGTFVVAGGCSGLNYLLIGVVLGLLQAHLSYRSVHGRLLVILVAIALALLSNWVRVVALVLIGYYTDMQSSLVDDHETFGWVVFAVALVPYFWLTNHFAEGEPERRGSHAGSRPHWPTLVPAVLLATAVALSAPLLALLAGQVERNNPAAGLLTPADFARSLVEPAWQPRFHDFDEQQAWQLRLDGREAEVLALTWLEQTQTRKMIYFSHRIASESQTIRQRRVALDDGFSVRETLVRDGPVRNRVVWSFYLVGGQATADERMARLLQLRGFVTGHPEAVLLTVSMPCRRLDCSDEQASLQRGEAGAWLRTLRDRLEGRPTAGITPAPPG